MKTTVLDLRQPDPCPEIQDDFAPSRKESVQIVQTNAESRWEAHQCKVEVSRSVTRCGIASLTFGTHVVEWLSTAKVPKEDCEKAVKTRELRFEDRVYGGLKLGTTTTTSYFSHGAVHANGACSVENFKRNGQSFESSYEITNLAITVAKVAARANREGDTIVLQEQVVEKFSEGVAFDSHLGTVVWHAAQRETCVEGLSEFYRGEAELHPLVATGNRSLTGAVLLVGSGAEALGTRTQHLGMILGAEVRVCQRSCYEVTALPSHVICPFHKDAPQLPAAVFRPEMLENHALDVLARSDYQFVSAMLAQEQKRARVVRQVCEVERQTKLNRLRLLEAAENGRALVQEPGYGQGFQVTPAGPSAAYVQRCVPVEVVHATVPNCTQEIPVREASKPQDGPIRYMDPITRTLSRYGTIVTCSEQFPVRWFINHQWFCSYPALRRCGEEPYQLQLSTEAGKISAGWTSLLNPGGIVSEQQQLLRARYINEHRLRGAMLTQTVRNGLTNGDGSSLGGAWSAADLDNVSNRVLEWMTPEWLLYLFGKYTNVVFGCLMVVSLTASFLAAVLRFGLQCRYEGWNDGRTLANALGAMCGVVTTPTRLGKEMLKHNHRELLRLFNLLKQGREPTEEDLEALRTPRSEKRLYPTLKNPFNGARRNLSTRSADHALYLSKRNSCHSTTTALTADGVDPPVPNSQAMAPPHEED